MHPSLQKKKKKILPRHVLAEALKVDEGPVFFPCCVIVKKVAKNDGSGGGRTRETRRGVVCFHGSLGWNTSCSRPISPSFHTRILSLHYRFYSSLFWIYSPLDWLTMRPERRSRARLPSCPACSSASCLPRSLIDSHTKTSPIVHCHLPEQKSGAGRRRRRHHHTTQQVSGCGRRRSRKQQRAKIGLERTKSSAAVNSIFTVCDARHTS